jgi:membrane protein
VFYLRVLFFGTYRYFISLGVFMTILLQIRFQSENPKYAFVVDANLITSLKNGYVTENISKYYFFSGMCIAMLFFLLSAVAYRFRKMNYNTENYIAKETKDSLGVLFVYMFLIVLVYIFSMPKKYDPILIDQTFVFMVAQFSLGFFLVQISCKKAIEYSLTNIDSAFCCICFFGILFLNSYDNVVYDPILSYFLVFSGTIIFLIRNCYFLYLIKTKKIMFRDENDTIKKFFGNYEVKK